MYKLVVLSLGALRGAPPPVKAAATRRRQYAVNKGNLHVQVSVIVPGSFALVHALIAVLNLLAMKQASDSFRVHTPIPQLYSKRHICSELLKEPRRCVPYIRLRLRLG